MRILAMAVFAVMFSLLLVLVWASSLDAQSRNCAPRDAVLERLADGYGESRQSIGMGANGAVVEVFANLESGSWTITVTNPHGIACLVASGQSFENLSEALPSKGDDI